MKRYFATLILVLICSSVWSQSNTSFASMKKNEVSMDLLGGFASMHGDWGLSYSIYYTRFLNQKLLIQSGIAFPLTVLADRSPWVVPLHMGIQTNHFIRLTGGLSLGRVTPFYSSNATMGYYVRNPSLVMFDAEVRLGEMNGFGQYITLGVSKLLSQNFIDYGNDSKRPDFFIKFTYGFFITW